jgi:isocitrate dehydrogenase (NAD+)
LLTWSNVTPATPPPFAPQELTSLALDSTPDAGPPSGHIEHAFDAAASHRLAASSGAHVLPGTRAPCVLAMLDFRRAKAADVTGRQTPRTIAVLEGDETGQELLEEALRVLAPDVVGLELELPRFDLSLASRRQTKNAVVHEAAAAVREAGLGLKAATVTPEGKDDVGSPNRILREEIGGHVIVRTGRRIPGVVPVGGVHQPISVVRMAVGDAYGAKEWREGEGEDEAAFRTMRIERRVCRAVAEFSFRHAERTRAKVFGGPKYTVSPVYEGMLKEEMDAAAERHPDVAYEPQLIDATFALLISSAGEALVIPALNRDGDILSDLVLPLFGSIAGSESLLVAFNEDYTPRALMAEAAHGTAPALFGKNVANPMAMILATAALLSHIDDDEARAAGRAVREACLEAVSAGVRTADLGGHAATTEFTDDVIGRVRSKLEVWATLGEV